MKTRLELQHMADGVDVLSMVPAEQLARVKELDPTPTLRAYAIAHEGVANPRLVGMGKVAVHYFREAVKRIHERLALGTPLFAGHGADNSTAGREVLGEVVGKALREIGGRLHEVAAVWIRPEHRARKLDVCSIEAEVELTGGDGAFRAVDVGDITGIALGDSGVNSPAFAGATLLADAQCWAAGEDRPMTLEELKKAVAELKAKPSDLFDQETLTADPVVKKDKQEEYEHARRLEKRLGEAREALSAKEAELATKAKEFAVAQVRGQAKTVFDALASERKLTDQQKGYLERALGKFQTTAEDEKGLKAELTKFLDDGLAELGEVAKLLGVTDEKPAGGPPTPASPGTDGDYADPKNNPLIPAEV